MLRVVRARFSRGSSAKEEWSQRRILKKLALSWKLPDVGQRLFSRGSGSPTRSHSAQSFKRNQHRIRTMKKHVTLAFVACTLLAGCQPDYPSFDLGGFQIGDNSDSVKAKISAVSCRNGERHDTMDCSGKGSTFERAPVLYTEVRMYGGHVERVSAIVDTSNADSILAAMKVEYGPPDERPSTDIRERLGFTTWTRANGENLEFQRVDGPQSVIFLTGPTYIKAHKANPRLDLPKPDI